MNYNGCYNTVKLLPVQDYRLGLRYNPSYTRGMKTAISIPDPIYEAAELLSRRLSMSRSELYAKAVERFVQTHQTENLTALINEVCDQVDTSVDPALRKMQSESLPRDEWK